MSCIVSTIAAAITSCVVLQEDLQGTDCTGHFFCNASCIKADLYRTYLITDIHTHTQTETDRQTDRQAGKQASRQAGGQVDRQTDKQTY